MRALALFLAVGVLSTTGAAHAQYKAWVLSKFDDTPEKYRGNVNVLSFPYNRHEGDPPAMDDDAIDAIVAFLETLTDEPYRSRAALANEHASNAELR